MGAFYRDVRAARIERRAKFGIECRVCKTQRPKGNATILLPGQICRVDGYRDSRKEATHD